jgi:hypothetical protein
LPRADGANQPGFGASSHAARLYLIATSAGGWGTALA